MTAKNDQITIDDILPILLDPDALQARYAYLRLNSAVVQQANKLIRYAKEKASGQQEPSRPYSAQDFSSLLLEHIMVVEAFMRIIDNLLRVDDAIYVVRANASGFTAHPRRNFIFMDEMDKWGGEAKAKRQFIELHPSAIVRHREHQLRLWNTGMISREDYMSSVFGEASGVVVNIPVQAAAADASTFREQMPTAEEYYDQRGAGESSAEAKLPPRNQRCTEQHLNNDCRRRGLPIYQWCEECLKTVKEG